ncbi:MAG: cyclase family protein, partial [Candidatus Latescibacterota bacterium]
MRDLRRRFLCVLLLAGASAANAQERVIDLTWPFDADTVYWPTAKTFDLDVVARGETPGGYWYEANQFCAAEHGGTHLDAPCHFAEGRRTVDAIPLEQLIGPAAVIDVRQACANDRDYRVQVADIRAH